MLERKKKREREICGTVCVRVLVVERNNDVFIVCKIEIVHCNMREKLIKINMFIVCAMRVKERV